jgi:hypothetical protein
MATLASSYGWAGVGVAVVAVLGMLLWALAAMRKRAADAATTTAVAAGNKVVSDANAAAVDSRATDRGATPGVVVRDSTKPTGDL